MTSKPPTFQTSKPLNPADFSADLTILEEGTELLHRIKQNAGVEGRRVDRGAAHAAPPLPMFTSCCPG
jgi:iron only hydrogenase large subunit-like protein